MRNGHLFVLFAVLAAWVVACSSSGDEKAVRQAVRDFAAAVAAGDQDEMLRLLHPESEFARDMKRPEEDLAHAPPLDRALGQVATGLAGAMVWTLVHALIPERLEIIEVTIGGSHAVVRYRGDTPASSGVRGAITLERQGGRWLIRDIKPGVRSLLKPN